MNATRNVIIIGSGPAVHTTLASAAPDEHVTIGTRKRGSKCWSIAAVFPGPSSASARPGATAGLRVLGGQRVPDRVIG